MNKHTQGKWKTDRENRVYGERPDNLPIAKIFDEYVGNDEAQANKNLILAAPELLAALKLVLNDLTGDFEDNEENRQATIETITTAIKKAEGGK